MSPSDRRAELPFGGICARALLYALEYARAQACVTGEDALETQRRVLEAQLEGVVGEERRRRERVGAGSPSDVPMACEEQAVVKVATGAERTTLVGRAPAPARDPATSFVLCAPLVARPATPMVRVVRSGPDWSEVVRLECVELTMPQVPSGDGTFAVESRERHTGGAWTPVCDADDDRPLRVPAGLVCRVGIGNVDDPTLEFRAVLVEWQCGSDAAALLTTTDLAVLLASDRPGLRDAALKALAYARLPEV